MATSWKPVPLDSMKATTPLAGAGDRHGGFADGAALVAGDRPDRCCRALSMPSERRCRRRPHPGSRRRGDVHPPWTPSRRGRDDRAPRAGAGRGWPATVFQRFWRDGDRCVGVGLRAVVRPHAGYAMEVAFTPAVGNTRVATIRGSPCSAHCTPVPTSDAEAANATAGERVAVEVEAEQPRVRLTSAPATTYLCMLDGEATGGPTA